MTLNAYAAEKRLAIFADLRNGLPPSQGSFNQSTLDEAKKKGEPQMGSTRYEPDSIVVEFIYPDPASTATVFSVRLDPPERIVFMPVPEWVVENIWQGDVQGTFHFESEARSLYEGLGRELQPDENRKWFEPQMAKRRE